MYIYCIQLTIVRSNRATPSLSSVVMEFSVKFSLTAGCKAVICFGITVDLFTMMPFVPKYSDVKLNLLN